MRIWVSRLGFWVWSGREEWVWLGREKWVRSTERMPGFVMGSLKGRKVEVVFVMVGSVRGSSEAEMGLAAWVEGERRKKKKNRRGGRGVGVGERENQKKNEGKQEEIGAKRLKGEACERESENETYVFY